MRPDGHYAHRKPETPGIPGNLPQQDYGHFLPEGPEIPDGPGPGAELCGGSDAADGNEEPEATVDLPEYQERPGISGYGNGQNAAGSAAGLPD